MKNAKLAIGAALAGAFALGAIAVGFTSAQTGAKTAGQESDDNMSHAPKVSVDTSFSDVQEDEIGALVRAYLLNNPEVIIEAVNKYSNEQRLAAERNSRQAAMEGLPYLLDPQTSFVAGKDPAKAKIAVIEFFDYHCGYCKRASGLVKKLVKSDADIKVVFREMPILREESAYAAEMALASRDQGKFVDFHFAMLDSSGVLTKDRVHEFARGVVLDVAKMESAVESDEIPNILQDNLSLAAALGIDGTPAFIIAALDGSYVEVVSGYDEATIEAKIKEAKKAVR